MKRKILVLLPLFFVFLIANVPISLLESQLKQVKNVNIGRVSGSVWSGNIQYIGTRQLSVSNVDFDLSVLMLLTGKVSSKVKIGDGDLKGNFLVVAGSDYQNNLELDQVNLRMSADLLSQLAPGMGLDASGNISTSDLSLLIENRKPSNAEGTVRWRGAAITIFGKKWTLGDFNLQLTTSSASKMIKGQLLDSKNALQLQGEVTLSADGVLEFVGSIGSDIDPTIYATLSSFKNGNLENGRLPIKFRKKIY